MAAIVSTGKVIPLIIYIQRIKVLQAGGVLAKAAVKRQRWSVVNAPPACACKLL
ncbi:hypothetical protein [Sporomusa sp.]|uniref:hypothetical protein n=1 Tax=Sporomusa sp. TaxID=2078658 RepID=UPI002CC21BCE|nr:hypothetical protein [Sporomusa sp.]HWR05657.1 hypothetical protein [Sporomusa sp.]